MKVVILCGGRGTRLKEETGVFPKPLVEIGGKPILWHIMNSYAHFGFNEFALALGYKGEKIKEYFVNYCNFQNDLTVSLKTGEVTPLNNSRKDWLVHMIDTGQNTLTGGRLDRLRDRLAKETFMLTYGDGVCNLNIQELLLFHKSHKKIATITAVRPTARFGGMNIQNNVVENFKEKPQTGEGWVNGGYFVFEKEIFNYLSGDETVLEREPLERLSLERQLMAYQHNGFWQCMDTLRDKEILEQLWASGDPPWKV